MKPTAVSSSSAVSDFQVVDHRASFRLPLAQEFKTLCISTNFWSTVVHSFLFLMVLFTLKLLPLPGKTPASYVYSHYKYSHVFILINGNVSLDDLERQWPAWQTSNVKNKRFKGVCRGERRQKDPTCNRRPFLIDMLWPQKERKEKKKNSLLLKPSETYFLCISLSFST